MESRVERRPESDPRAEVTTEAAAAKASSLDAETLDANERFHLLEELFLAASELAKEEQVPFLEQQGAPPSMVQEVLELLGHSQDAAERLGAAIDAGLGWVAEQPERPSRLGPYRVIEELGRGGLGVVYLAERDDAEFRMRVAIKVVRPGVHNRQLEKRLQRERQILAGLEHPHIARILDGGSTEQGASFLVMELVEGEPITDYCRRHQLPLRRRLELFRKVCDAVHYAHRNLVLHRDLKPSNILVTENDIPKLLDFGIAKVLDEDVDDAGPDQPVTLTGPGMRLLTPEYASPEQMLGQPLTTGSDVYSLGVLLHEMLVGNRPYEIDRQSPSQIEQVVCRQDPERPSQAHRRLLGSKAPWDPDLDNIVGMTLRKEPERRYASALQLSEDIRNYLEDLPVVARADSVGYRMGKFARRHRVAVSAAMIVLITLVTAVALTSHQAGVARQERARAEQSLVVAQQERAEAERERRRSDEVADFMIEIFEVSDPSKSRGDSVTAREVLDEGARRIRWQLQDNPTLRTTLMTTMGRVYRQLDLYDAAERLLEDAIGAAPLENPSDFHEAEGLRQLGLLRLDQGRLEESERLLNASVAGIQAQNQTGRPVHSDYLLDLARVYELLDRQERVSSILDEALDIRIAHFGDSSAEVAEIRDRLASHLYNLGDYDRAEALCRQALDARRRLYERDHPHIALSLNNLAAIRYAQGDPEEAEQLFEEALQLRRRLYGDVHSTVAQSLSNLANVRMARGAIEDGDRLLTEALDLKRQIYGEDHHEVAESLYILARLKQRRRQRDQAREMFTRSLEIRRRHLGEKHPKVIQSLLGLASLAIPEDAVLAEDLYREVVFLQRESLADDDYRRGYALQGLGRLLLPREPQEAEDLLREAYELFSAALPAEDPQVAWAKARLARSLGAQGRTEEALPVLREVASGFEQRLGADHPSTQRVRGWIKELEPPSKTR